MKERVLASRGCGSVNVGGKPCLAIVDDELLLKPRHFDTTRQAIFSSVIGPRVRKVASSTKPTKTKLVFMMPGCYHGFNRGAVETLLPFIFWRASGTLAAVLTSNPCPCKTSGSIAWMLSSFVDAQGTAIRSFGLALPGRYQSSSCR